MNERAQPPEVAPARDAAPPWPSPQSLDERIRLIVDAANDAFVALSDQGVVTEWNRSAETLFGWSRAEAVGRVAYSVIESGELEAEAEKMLAAAAQGGAPPERRRFEIKTRRRDGTEVNVQMTLWPVVVDGELTLNAFMHDLGERLRFQEELRQLAIAATTDQGTGLKNRRGFFALAEHELNVAQRLGQTLTLIFLDLDHLKHVNDSFGHIEGDRAIADTADVLRKTFRESDLIARLGGDEFCVLALGPRTAFDRAIARLEENIAARNEAAHTPYPLSLSYGVAYYDPAEGPASLDDLMSRADTSMYRRKQRRNRSA